MINKAVYLALGVNLEGHKVLLGLWLAENEGAKFWLSVLTELQNRGVKDILIACVDGGHPCFEMKQVTSEIGNKKLTVN